MSGDSPAMTEAEQARIDVISNIQQSRPPVFPAQINRCRSRYDTPKRPVGNVIEESQNEENCSGDGNRDAEISLQVELNDVELFPENVIVSYHSNKVN